MGCRYQIEHGFLFGFVHDRDPPSNNRAIAAKVRRPTLRYRPLWVNGIPILREMRPLRLERPTARRHENDNPGILIARSTPGGSSSPGTSLSVACCRRKANTMGRVGYRRGAASRADAGL